MEKGLFFWRKKPTETEKAEEMLKLYMKHLPALRKIMRDEDSDERTDGTIIGEMYDYWENIEEEQNIVTGVWTHADTLAISKESEDNRKEVTPVSVRHELEGVPTPFNIDHLDEKISTLIDKVKLLRNPLAKKQVNGLIKRLENRKKYKYEAKFYSSFPNTSDDKIEELLSKYKLVMKKSDLFVPTFPKDAIEIMKKYTEVTKNITGETPVYYVIAEIKDFKKKEKKLDPILLAQSPFGFYMQVLGAWSHEMLLLSEL